MTTFSDDQLIATIQRDPNSPALRLLFNRYRPVLTKLQRVYYIPGHDGDDWEQEGLLVLHGAAQKFRQHRSCNFGAFYRLNLTHRVFDLIRYSQAQKRRATTISLEANRTYFAETLHDTRVQLGIQLEAQEAVGRVLPGLSPTEQVVFRGLLGGLTPQAISQQEGLSMTRVSAAMHRGRQKLRRLLGE